MVKAFSRLTTAIDEYVGKVKENITYDDELPLDKSLMILTAIFILLTLEYYNIVVPMELFWIAKKKVNIEFLQCSSI